MGFVNRCQIIVRMKRLLKLQVFNKKKNTETGFKKRYDGTRHLKEDRKVSESVKFAKIIRRSRNQIERKRSRQKKML